jgi:hypothetical protein
LPVVKKLLAVCVVVVICETNRGGASPSATIRDPKDPSSYGLIPPVSYGNPMANPGKDGLSCNRKF